MKRNDINDGEKAIERMTDGAWSPGGKADITAQENGPEYPPTFRLNKKQKELRVPLVRRRAFSQKEIELTDVPDAATKRAITEAFTKRVTDAEAKAMRSLQKAVRAVLKPLVPSRARACFYFHPQLMKEHPGFLYTTADGKVSVWVVPRLPIFLEKIDEMEVIRELCCDDTSPLDAKAVAYDAAKRRRDDEVRRIAAVLNETKDGKPVTFLDFVKDRPLYFDAMYRIITGKDLLEGVQTE